MNFKSSKFNLRIVLVFLAGLIVLLGIVCGKDKPTEPGHETIPPRLLFTSPANTATKISIDGIISATFSEPIDSTTVNDSTFFVNNGITGSYSFSGNTIYLTPSAPLTYSAVYTCQLTTGITDSVGNHLTGNVTWSFTAEPDPATTSPTVVSVAPVNGAVNIYGDTIISATFDKGMDASTLNITTFSLNNGATGTVSYNNNIATYSPDDTLIYDTVYTATISTAVADTFGNNLETEYSWNFSTIEDPFIPLVSFSHPFDSAIVDDAVTTVVDITHPVGVDSVEFFIDNVIISSATDRSPPFGYQIDASAWEIGSVHTLWTKAYYGPVHVGYSDTLDIIYLWELMATDGDEGIPQDLRRMFARSTETVMELRYEFGTNWSYPYPRTDSQVNDSIINLGIYLDSDANPATGDLTLGDPGVPLNGIGADHRIILSSLITAGRDTALAFWNDNTLPAYWDLVFDTTGFNYHNVPVDTNVLEFGINWSDLNSSYGAYIMSFHTFIAVETIGATIDTTFTFDWLPNQGAGYVTVFKEGRYIGAPFSAGKIRPPIRPQPSPSIIRTENNPFK